MQTKLTILTILLIILLLSGCSTDQVNVGDNGPATYEQKLEDYSKELDDIRSNIPDPDYPLDNNEEFDYEQNTKRLKMIYGEIKALKPDKNLESRHKEIVRSLKYAVEGAEMLELSKEGKSKSLYTQAIILMNVNLNATERVFEIN